MVVEGILEITLFDDDDSLIIVNTNYYQNTSIFIPGCAPGVAPPYDAVLYAVLYAVSYASTSSPEN